MRWFVGTSGWSYDSWVGQFYPGDMPSGQRLRHYATKFDAVEVNNSFYHLPSHEQLLEWQKEVPKDFTFAIKGSRYITHNKKLKDAEESLPKLMEPLKRLSKFGPLLFQLPPRFHKNEGRLGEFLEQLPKNHRCAIEFRDPDWHDEGVYDMLRAHNVAFCLFEKGEQRSPRLSTADFSYVRLHGRKAGYKGNYDAESLRGWRDWLAEEEQDAYVFFDNTDEKLYAVENALDFRRMAEG